MADEDAEDVEKGTDNGADGGADELTAEDWKAKYEEAIKHSREWEKRAKANKNAARTLDDANAAAKNAEDALAEAEKQAKDAESKLADYKHSAEVAALKAAVSAETGVPAGLLQGETEDDLKASAEALMNWSKGRPRAPFIKNPAGAPNNKTNETSDAAKAIAKALFGTNK